REANHDIIDERGPTRRTVITPTAAPTTAGVATSSQLSPVAAAGSRLRTMNTQAAATRISSTSRTTRRGLRGRGQVTSALIAPSGRRARPHTGATNARAAVTARATAIANGVSPSVPGRIAAAASEAAAIGKATSAMAL